jgi:hypothetical protein
MGRRRRRRRRRRTARSIYQDRRRGGSGAARGREKEERGRSNTYTSGEESRQTDGSRAPARLRDHGRRIGRADHASRRRRGSGERGAATREEKEVEDDGGKLGE